jgi:LemA protein
MGTFIVLALLVLLVIFAVGIYNRIITLENRFQNAWSQIDVQLKRRNDLVPNLVLSGAMPFTRGQCSRRSLGPARR